MYHLRDTATYLQNKKLLLSLGVVAGAVFLITIGVWIENKIVDGAERKAQMYQTAIQTQSDNEFNYSIDTKQGRILAEVTLNSVDKVKFPEMNKEFVKVEKTKEEFTRHERTVCNTEYDADGNATTECHQETYYSWDTIDEWNLSAQEVEMSGRNYSIDKFALGSRSIHAKDIIPGETGEYVREEADSWLSWGWGDDEGDIRYGYSVLELPKSGTVFLNVTESVQPVFGGRIVLDGQKPAELVKNAQNDAETQMTIFRVFWTILVLLELLGLGFLVWFHESY